MNTRQRTKGGTYINTTVQLTSAISVLLRCNSDVSFPILGYLNRAKISWVMSDWGGGRPPRPPSKYAPVSKTD